MIDIRVRSKVADSAVRELAGKVLGPRDYDVLLTGPARVRMPDNRLLCVYLPGVLVEVITPERYEILHGLRSQRTENRGLASGTRLIQYGTQEARPNRVRAVPIASAIIGAFDGHNSRKFCRLTAWTGRNLPKWQQLHPLLQAIAGHLAEQVPDRYEAQRAYAQATDPAWVVPDTPFTTVTVNNSYATGVHTDKGDLDAGYSTIAVLRRGDYTGGQLIFPQYRVAVDMRDGDLILMDAHQWHGNVPLTCQCGTRLNGPCKTCTAERISLVSYFRTKIRDCGDLEAETRKADDYSLRDADSYKHSRRRRRTGERQ